MLDYHIIILCVQWAKSELTRVLYSYNCAILQSYSRLFLHSLRLRSAILLSSMMPLLSCVGFVRHAEPHFKLSIIQIRAGTDYNAAASAASIGGIYSCECYSRDTVDGRSCSKSQNNGQTKLRFVRRTFAG